MFLALLAGAVRYYKKKKKQQELESHRAAKVEPAYTFSPEKFATTIEAIDENSVPASCCLVFWYFFASSTNPLLVIIQRVTN